MLAVVDIVGLHSGTYTLTLLLLHPARLQAVIEMV